MNLQTIKTVVNPVSVADQERALGKHSYANTSSVVKPIYVPPIPALEAIKPLKRWLASDLGKAPSVQEISDLKRALLNEAKKIRGTVRLKAAIRLLNEKRSGTHISRTLDGVVSKLRRISKESNVPKIQKYLLFCIKNSKEDIASVNRFLNFLVDYAHRVTKGDPKLPTRFDEAIAEHAMFISTTSDCSNLRAQLAEMLLHFQHWQTNWLQVYRPLLSFLHEAGCINDKTGYREEVGDAFWCPELLDVSSELDCKRTLKTQRHKEAKRKQRVRKQARKA